MSSASETFFLSICTPNCFVTASAISLAVTLPNRRPEVPAFAVTLTVCPLSLEAVWLAA